MIVAGANVILRYGPRLIPVDTMLAAGLSEYWIADKALVDGLVALLTC